MIEIKEINPQKESIKEICEYLDQNITAENLRTNGGTLNYTGLVNYSSLLLIAYDNGEPVGFNSLGIIDGVCYILQIAVKRSYHHKGIGTMLMNRAITIAEEKKCSITAHVRDYNIASRGMFTKLGFEKIGESVEGNGLYQLPCLKKTIKS